VDGFFVVPLRVFFYYVLIFCTCIDIICFHLFSSLLIVVVVVVVVVVEKLGGWRGGREREKSGKGDHDEKA